MMVVQLLMLLVYTTETPLPSVNPVIPPPLVMSVHVHVRKVSVCVSVFLTKEQALLRK